MLNMTAQLLSTDKFDGLKDKIFPSDIFVIGGFRINNSVISGFIVVAVLLIVAVILRLTVIRHWKTTPSGAQMFLEWLVTFFDKSADEMTEEYSGLMGPYTLGAAAYICCGVLIEMFGLRPAIADIGACFALALCTFLFIHTLGFHKNKARRLLHFLNPINIVTDLSVPVSMTFRLFGSILSGMVIMDMIYILVEGIWYIGLPLILPAVYAVPRVHPVVRLCIADAHVCTGGNRNSSQKAKAGQKEKAGRGGNSAGFCLTNS